MNLAAPAAREIERNSQEVPDADLVAAVRAGDERAFAELYRRHQPAVARFVRGRVRDRGRAEDVVQEAFVSALRRMRQTDSELAFRAWIFEIARNASIDLYRRSSRAEEVSMDADGGLSPGDAGRLRGSVTPDASLLRKESFDHFRGALDELSTTHHRIIVMRELEGRSYREIGERMELSQAAVESTLFRARRRLEHEYQQLDSGDRCRLVGAAMGRLAEGLESARDRLALDRHARRCSACRRQSRQLGVEPLLGERRRRLATRAAALLPLPGFLRGRGSSGGSDGRDGLGLNHAGGQIGATFGPAIEVSGGLAGKAVALIAAVVLIGGGGATLGGAGPFAVGGQGALPAQTAPAGKLAPTPAPSRAVGHSERKPLEGRGIAKPPGGARLDPGAGAGVPAPPVPGPPPPSSAAVLAVPAPQTPAAPRDMPRMPDPATGVSRPTALTEIAPVGEGTVELAAPAPAVAPAQPEAVAPGRAPTAPLAEVAPGLAVEMFAQS